MAETEDTIPDEEAEENAGTLEETELAQARQRITTLEAELASRDADMDSFRKSEAELKRNLSEREQEYRDSVGAYRSLVLQLNPAVATELVAGDTVTAVNESLAKAKAVVGRVRETMAKEAAAARVPIGTPARQNPDLSALSPREKINYGIGGKR